jgi:hypothetical protein
MPGAGWVLGAGLTVLALIGLLRVGIRRERRAGPAAWVRRRDEMDLVGAVLGFHSMEEDEEPSGGPAVARRAAPQIRPASDARPAVRRPRRARAPARRPPPTGTGPARPRLVRERLGFDTPRRPSATTAWLHLVSGATPAETARVACAVAADLIERGGRVLLMDAGRRCLLHARFSREARWGLGECLDGSLPVLGVVQDTGHTGLHLLARGGEPSLSWHALGRLADEAHAHFEHVLVAVDSDVPREAGTAIAGRLVEGWWAGERLPERAAGTLSERLGVVFSAMPLDAASERSLGPAAGAVVPSTPDPILAEGSGTIVPGAGPARVGAAIPGDALTSTASAIPSDAAIAGDIRITPGSDLASESAGPTGAVELAGRVGEPDTEMVLACDGDVRSRLEFLMWVRRMTRDAPARPAPWQLADAGVPV